MEDQSQSKILDLDKLLFFVKVEMKLGQLHSIWDFAFVFDQGMMKISLAQAKRVSSFAKDSIACFIVPVSSAYQCNSFRASYVVLHQMATKVKQLLERKTRYV